MHPSKQSLIMKEPQVATDGVDRHVKGVGRCVSCDSTVLGQLVQQPLMSIVDQGHLFACLHVCTR